ncbi:hypothetical protein CC85DRAFT_270230 [Cutaneotrichosporon oleaginosum]|uniref:N-acetyltransferase domain-containing protein n=1 Tax=Cutaneotrichosporon oleaginosum TaxID=879819 RepID=A0A0J1BB07_9TREE|nr:uncharacterized protein CC85DRAFT_270230 [Cutaneotrichosporon oleaginosum]KLT45124.1 hypothetical protein CC85DRAFT_270230 [Cutaneotrichosporon oleaginosum]TXT09804.1 hypothetical protein COLE_03738 [Cutaneotrichosporon oleaginosum]
MSGLVSPTESLTIRLIPPEETHFLRHAVLWPTVPLSAQAQPYDASPTIHLGAFHSSSPSPIGVLTLVPAHCTCSPEYGVQLPKFAVSTEWQGRGVGGAMLAAAIQYAAGAVQLDARLDQRAFYEKRGFAALSSQTFTKCGPGGAGPPIEYVRMRRTRIHDV